MQVKGESTLWLDLTGSQKFEEASVKKDNNFGFFGLFGSKSITIDAGAGDDLITVKKAGPDQYEVNINGQAFILSKEEMKNLNLKGGAGNDTIIIDPSVDVEINVDGGAGDDTIVNFADGTTINGGEGDDTIVSIANFAKIMGDAGRDSIRVSGHFNEVHGDSETQNFWDLLFGGNTYDDDIQTDGFFNSVQD